MVEKGDFIAIRVLMLTGAYYPEISGAGLQCKTLIRAAQDRALQFSVITTCRDQSLPFLDCVEGVPVYRLKVRKGFFFTLACWLPGIFYLIFKELLPADIIHLHGISRKSYFFLAFGFIFRKQVLLKMTSLGEDDPESVRLRGILHNFFYSLASFYLVPSQALEKKSIRCGISPERLFRLPNGVDLERFHPGRTEEKRAFRTQLGLPQDDLVVFFTGHYSLDKRPHFLAEAWSDLKVSGVSLVLLGSSSLDSYEVSADAVRKVNEVAGKSSLPGKLITIQHSERIEDYYRAADIFVLPSAREGMPNALLEAMASGLACIAARLPGITDILLDNGSCGILFQPDNREELIEALEKLSADQALREKMGLKAQQKASTAYDIRDAAQSYREFVLGISGRHKENR